MYHPVSIEDWSNESLIDLTIKQGLLVSKNDVSDSAQLMREEALERNKKELLRRLNKNNIREVLR